MTTPVSDDDRERTALVLQKACGDGRLTLEEFTVRVGAVWAADSSAELTRATSGVAVAPVVGATQTVEKVVTIFSESKRRGRWRLPHALRTLTLFGSCELDLRDVMSNADVLEISGRCIFGEIKVIVPEGVEVEVTGATVFASRDLRLAPVPRLAGTPLIRVNVDAYFGSVEVRSRGPRDGSQLAEWLRDKFSL
jgi:hypothetical protein